MFWDTWYNPDELPTCTVTDPGGGWGGGPGPSYQT